MYMNGDSNAYMNGDSNAYMNGDSNGVKITHLKAV